MATTMDGYLKISINTQVKVNLEIWSGHVEIWPYVTI